MEKILIRFMDNDFSWLMTEFGNIVLRFKNYNRRRYVEEWFSKAEIVELFNNIAKDLYHFFTGEERKADDNYIMIEEKDVFIDKEVDEKLLTYSSWGNGDSIFIDFSSNYICIM